MKKFEMKASAAMIALASAIGICAPALAQNQATGDDASGSGFSGNAGDIIVTARRVEERLQDVPISMTVFTQEDLTRRNIVNQADLAAYTPALTINQRFGPEKSSFVIRGFTQESRTSPSVAVYFADVVVPRAQGGTTSGNTAAPGSFFDLQNVQVLKGPQGTLFGRNTTGGAVLLVPQRPTDRLEGYIEASVGNYDMRRAQAVLNVPLADTFRVRLGVDRQKRDGYLRNHGTGPDLNDSNYIAARLSMEMDLTEGLENYLVVTYSDSDTTGFGAHMQICNPAPAGSTARVLAPLACAQIARQSARGDSLLDVETSIPDSYIKIRQMQIIDHLTWQASDTITIKNIASYSSIRERSNFSNSGDNFTVPASGPLFGAVPPEFIGRPYGYINIRSPVGGDLASQESFTEELQIIGRSADDRLNWQLGAYLEISNPLGFSSSTAIPIGASCSDPANPTTGCVNPLGIGTISYGNTRTWFNNKGFYAQGSYKLTDQLSFTGGLRYTIDTVRALGQIGRARFVAPLLSLPEGVRGTYQDLICGDQLRFNSPDGPDAGTLPDPLVVNSLSECSTRFKTKSKRPTWLVGVDFKPDDDILLYAKYSRGYRQGGVDPSLFGIETWGPEKLDAYEVGMKTSFSSNSVRGTFNVAGYYNDFTDQQITVLLTPKAGAIGGSSSAVVNAGSSRIWGAEADASITLFDHFRLDAGYAYLNTKLLSLDLPIFPPESIFLEARGNAATGGPLTYSPKHRVTATATYTLPLDKSIGDISIGGTYTYTASQLSTSPENSPIYVLPPQHLVNLNVDWRNVLDRPVDLSAFVTNLTNNVYPVAVTQGYSTNGWDSVLVSPPRMWGVRLRYRFGD